MGVARHEFGGGLVGRGKCVGWRWEDGLILLRTGFSARPAAFHVN